MDEIDLKLDEDNELLFQVVIEGAREQPSAIRSVCEGEQVSYMFKGTLGSEPGEIKVQVPPMQNTLKEGTYDAKLEVLIDGKYLSPLSVKTRFSKSLKVVVTEAVKVSKPELRVTAVTKSVTLKDKYLTKVSKK